MTRVKICGVRTYQEANWAATAGAWAVGFVFAPSRRRIAVDDAARIICELPPTIHKVGVFVDMDMEMVKEIARYTGIDMVQLHGQERPEYCAELHLPVIKSFQVKDADSLAEVEDYRVFAYLFDTYQEGCKGGTGKTFDWRYLGALSSTGKRVVVAGGLDPSNVAEAIRLTKPYAVDVSSGVEVGGRKERGLVEEFIRRVNN